MRRIIADCFTAPEIKFPRRNGFPDRLFVANRLFNATLKYMPHNQRSTGSNLTLIQWLRDFAIAGLAAIALLAKPVFYTLVPLSSIFALLGLWVAISIFTRRRLKRTTSIGDHEILMHIGIDLAMLTMLLALCGGPANPLTILYLPTVAVAAAALPMRPAWLVALSSIAAYSLLWKFSVPLTVEDVDRAMQMHLTGMWLTFAVSALLIAGFVARITATLRERERQLAAAREQALRDERIVALGNLAAGAAHELGTPLATMAVIAGELVSDAAIPLDQRTDIKLLVEQITACKSIISGLAERTGMARAEAGGAITVDRWIEKIVARWHSLRPQVNPQLTLKGGAEQSGAPRIFSEATLEQALLSLFNNAADASPDDIEIVAYWSQDRLQLDILDRGPGIDAAQLQRVGRDFFSTRPDGAGIGLFLAHAALDRYDGSITMEMRDGGGTRTHVELPLQALLAEDASA